MQEWIKKSDVLELLSLPPDIFSDYVYELKGIWMDEDECEDFRDINRYLNCLDDMADFLDEEDELSGLPDGVFEAQEKLYEYFVVLYRLRKKQHKI